MNYLKEQLETQYNLNFADVRKEIILFNLDVYADLVYIEVRLHNDDDDFFIFEFIIVSRVVL